MSGVPPHVMTLILAGAIVVGAHESLWSTMYHQTAKSKQLMSSRPCSLFNQWVDCSVLFGSIQPNQAVTQQVTNDKLHAALHNLEYYGSGYPQRYSFYVPFQPSRVPILNNSLRRWNSYFHPQQITASFSSIYSFPKQVESRNNYRKFIDFTDSNLKDDSERAQDYLSRTTIRGRNVKSHHNNNYFHLPQMTGIASSSIVNSYPVEIGNRNNYQKLIEFTHSKTKNDSERVQHYLAQTTIRGRNTNIQQSNKYLHRPQMSGNASSSSTNSYPVQVERRNNYQNLIDFPHSKTNNDSERALHYLAQTTMRGHNTNIQHDNKYLHRSQMTETASSSSINSYPVQVESQNNYQNLIDFTHSNIKHDPERAQVYLPQKTIRGSKTNVQQHYGLTPTMAPLMSTKSNHYVQNAAENSKNTSLSNQIPEELVSKLSFHKNKNRFESFNQNKYNVTPSMLPLMVTKIEKGNHYVQNTQNTLGNTSNKRRELVSKLIKNENFIKPYIQNKFDISQTIAPGTKKEYPVKNEHKTSNNTSFSNGGQLFTSKSTRNESLIEPFIQNTIVPLVPENKVENHYAQTAPETSNNNTSFSSKKGKFVTNVTRNEGLIESFLQDKYNIQPTIVPFLTEFKDEYHYAPNASESSNNTSFLSKKEKNILNVTRNEGFIQSFIKDKYNLVPTIETLLNENKVENQFVQNASKTSNNTSFSSKGEEFIPNLTRNEGPIQSYIQDKYNISPTIVPFLTENKEENQYAQNAPETSTQISFPNDVREEVIPETLPEENKRLFKSFQKSLDRLERKFFLTSFTKLTAISPEDRRENGISFLQSGLFLHLLLVSLSTEMDQNATREIEQCIGLNETKENKIKMLEEVVSWLPSSSDELKFRWSSRLVLGRSANASHEFQRSAAEAMKLKLSWLNGTETPAEITKAFNKMVETDSGGAMHDTFEEEELSKGVCGVALSTVYIRGRWRSPPTLLNDSRPFRDADATPQRSIRLFRINDVMGYAYLHEWDAEAIEISYATPGLTLLIVVPKTPSLPKLVEQVARFGLTGVLAAMSPMRLAVTLPLYTLRMTLLLPNKLEDMGMSSLINTNVTDCNSLKFSHAVQRLMFWAEAGRNAYKDDGIEWDPRPEMELMVDRPYLFFVRWHNVTLMNGNFVL